MIETNRGLEFFYGTQVDAVEATHNKNFEELVRGINDSQRQECKTDNCGLETAVERKQQDTIGDDPGSAFLVGMGDQPATFEQVSVKAGCYRCSGCQLAAAVTSSVAELVNQADQA